jgi:hypothetical protein
MVTLFVHPFAARADWLLSAYLGTSKTAANTVEIDPNSGGTFEVGPIAYENGAAPVPLSLLLGRLELDKRPELRAGQCGRPPSNSRSAASRIGFR